MNATEITNLINQIRQDNGLNQLQSNSGLLKSAQERADYLCTTNAWSHDGWLEVVSQYYNWGYAGENLARNFLTNKGTVNGWVNSPSHYQNIVEPRFTETGVAVSLCAGKNYVVQHFGVPKEVEKPTQETKVRPIIQEPTYKPPVKQTETIKVEKEEPVKKQEVMSAVQHQTVEPVSYDYVWIGFGILIAILVTIAVVKMIKK